MDEISNEIQKALEVLGLPPLVTREDIKNQYYYLAKKHHPDLNSDSKKMETINNSYELIKRYIDQFRYTFSEDEIRRQFPGADFGSKFRP